MPAPFLNISGMFNRSADAMVANFRVVDEVAQRQFRRAVVEHAEKVVRLTRAYSPVDTGFMRDHVRYELSPSGLIAQHGWWADDFFDAGLEFYPPFQEFGTSRHPAQPSLYPAVFQLQPAFAKRMADITAASVRRLAKRRAA
jgi:HK97 gp10 family phage protein